MAREPQWWCGKCKGMFPANELCVHQHRPLRVLGRIIDVYAIVGSLFLVGLLLLLVILIVTGD